MISSYGAVTVDCGVTIPHVLGAGGSLECSYSTGLPNGDSRTNTATVDTTGTVGGASADAAVLFGDPTTVVNGSVNVDDSVAGDLGSFSDSGSVSYSRTFSCDGDGGSNDNTATIVETGQSSSASVTVNCYELTVTKDAATSLTRTWDWTIDKTADQTELLLADGQLFTVNYEVTVDATSTDSDWSVTGNISVANPAPIDATINTVADIVSPGIAATVDCGVTFPHVLGAGETLECTYSADLPDGATRLNTATAVLQNTLQNTPSGTTDFSGSANVDFTGATVTEVDECIDMSDTNVGPLGTVCAGNAPQTFTYSLTFGSHPDADVVLECGDNTHVNVASFVTNDTKVTDSSSWTVNATVACDFGCTLTPGYWKTHSRYGPAHADDAWYALGDADGDGTSEGPDERFFASGKTYYQVLWTSPAGNAYYILAHAYIAAELNIANGTSTTPAVNAAMAGAEALFAAQGPNDTTLTRTERNAAIGYATTLDNYNNGLTGPGHCSR